MRLQVGVNISEALRFLEERKQQTITACIDAVSEATNRVWSDADARVPRASGELESDLHIQISEDLLSGEVQDSSDHAIFVELGTGQRGSASSTTPLPDGYAYGPSPGDHAQPYLWPALTNEMVGFQGEIEQKLREFWF